MISTEINKICKKPELIENYEKAVNDKTQTYICHHRLEEFVSKQWLIDHNDYYNVSPNELIFLTRSEYRGIHNTFEDWKKGNKSRSEKISKSLKGKPGDHTQKHSSETKRKMSEIRAKHNTGCHWYNNGEIEVFQKECPKGFKKGRLGGWKNPFSDEHKRKLSEARKRYLEKLK